MALSIHWEWRAFGIASAALIERFVSVTPPFDDRPQQLVDEYLWIPGVDINLKFRQGTDSQDGLKFKRLAETHGEFEKWVEVENEIFPFPLGIEAWNLLRQEMPTVRGHPFHPPREASRNEAVHFLKTIEPGTQTVVVRKERRSRLWDATASCTVKIELATILTPTRTTSIGLEILDRHGLMDDAQSIALLKEVHADLALQEEALEPMNYLDYMRGCAR